MIAVAGLWACGGGSTAPTRGGGPVGSIIVGSGIQFVSDHNGSMNPAVDTITAGTTATWHWTGRESHSVESIGSLRFASSGILTGTGTHSVTFTVPGTYQYDCAVHGRDMTGTLVVR